MIGLSLEGGGTKGAYQVGAIKAFNEAGINFNGITGTSIGAINAALILTGKTNDLENFWLNENISELLGLSKDINHNNFINYIKNITREIKNVQNKSGLDINKLKLRLNNLIDEDIIRSNKVDYGLVTYRVNDKTPLYLFKEDIPSGKLIDYIIASAFLPIFKPVKLDGDNFYLDGGFYDNSPSNMLEEKKYKKIYVISLNAVAVKRKSLGKSTIIKISPSRALGSMLNTDKMKIYDNIEMGYVDTMRVLKKLDGYKYLFKSNNNLFYKYLTRKVPDKILKRVEVFFFTRNKKDLIIKSMEYIFTKEKYSYSKIYDLKKEIKKFKNNNNEFIIYKFIKYLK